MRSVFRFWLTGPILLCAPTWVHAQQDAEPVVSEDTAPDEIVVTGYGRTNKPTGATGLRLSPLETPQTISTITTQQIDDQGFNTINDALDFTVGISKQDVDRGRSTISARGFDVHNFQLDGAPFVNGNVGFGESSTAQYERVDLIRGAAGLMQGAGDPSAVVNMIRKHATENEFAGYISVETASWDRFAATLDVQSPLNAAGTVRARAVAQVYKQNAFVDLEKKWGILLYGVIDADLGERTTLSVGASYQRDERNGVMWAQLPYWFQDGTRTNWPRSKSTGADWGFWHTDEISAFATFAHKLADNWQIRGDVGYLEGFENSKLIWLTGSPNRNTGAGINTMAYWYKAEPAQWHGNIQVNGSFALLGGQHDLALGVMSSRSNNAWTNRDADTVQQIPNYNSFDGKIPEPKWGRRYTISLDTDITQAAIYASTRINLIDGLKIIGGGRLSYYKLNEHKSKFGFDYSLSYKGQLTICRAGL